MKATVLGLGIMGRGVAATLLREGFEVTVWNRSAGKASELVSAGAVEASSPAQAVADADVVVSILFDADSVLHVFGEAAGSVPQSALWVQSSTIGIDGARRVAKAAEAAGVALVEAMMLGTKIPAERGALVMLAAGDPGLLEQARPLLEAMGSKTVVAGPSIGDGSALKLASNAWIASITAATAQSLALTEALGLDGDLFLQAIDGGASDTPYAHTKGASMIAHEYPTQFALDGLRKDVGLISEAAAGAGVDTGLLDALSGLYAGASRRGHGADDIAAVREGFSTAG